MPEDGGFTLVELLVVVIVIGILTGVAVPVYLSQRSKALDAAVRSDLRTLTTYVTAALLEGSDPADLRVGVLAVKKDGTFGSDDIYDDLDQAIRSGEVTRVRYALCYVSRLPKGTTGAGVPDETWCDLTDEPGTRGVYPMAGAHASVTMPTVSLVDPGATGISWCVNLRYGAKPTHTSYYDLTGAHAHRYTPERGVEPGACREVW